jgi:flagellar biosynthesis protein FliR
LLSGIISAILLSFLEFLNLLVLETVRHGFLGFFFCGLAGIVLGIVLAIIVAVLATIGGFIGGVIANRTFFICRA